jgi:hypothetical protein
MCLYVPLLPSEIRHQRSPDVVFDYMTYRDWRTTGDGFEEKPEWFVHSVVETLLPYARWDDGKGRGAMLELWASPGTHRKGWTAVAEVPV